MLFQAFKHPASSAWRYFPLFFAGPLLTHQGSASTLREASHNQLFPQALFSTCTSAYDNCFMPIYWPPSSQWILHTGNPQNPLQSWYTKRIQHSVFFLSIREALLGRKTEGQVNTVISPPWTQISSSVACQLWDSRKATSPFCSSAATSPKWKYY